MGDGGTKKVKRSAFGRSSTAEQVTEGIDGGGLTAIVTGGTSGIGKETVRVFAKRGVHVFMGARNMGAAAKVKEEILKENPTARLDLLQLDVSSLESVRKAAHAFLALNCPLNILVNNAGIMMRPFQLSKDGIESQFATNYLGHFLLTNLLLEKLKETAKESGIEGKIINVSSNSHHTTYKEGIRFEKLNDKNGYSPYSAYGQSKLAQVLTTLELSHRLEEEKVNVVVNVLHPGLIRTNLTSGAVHPNVIAKAIFGGVQYLPIWKTIPQGAATTTYLALNPLAAGVTGKYFIDCKEANKASKFAKDDNLVKKFWDFSVQLTAPSSGT